MKNVILLIPEDVTVGEELKGKEVESPEVGEENQATERTKERNTRRENRFERREIHKRIYTEKDESLEKFQVKFEKPNKYELTREEI
jgi:hypothetical protein